MSRKTKPKPKGVVHYKRPLLLATIGLVALVACVAITLAAFTVLYKDKIYPKTYIGAINFGGKSIDQAKAILTDRANRIPTESIIRVDGENQATLSLTEAGLTYNTTDTLNHLLATGRSKDLRQSLVQLVKSLVSSNRIIATFTFDETKFDEVVARVINQVNTPAKDAGVLLQEDGKLTLSSATNGRAITSKELIGAIKTGLGTFDYSVAVTSQTINPNVADQQVSYAITQTQEFLNRAPFVITAGRTQITVDQPKLFSWLTYQLKPNADIPELTVPTATTSPLLTTWIFHTKAYDPSKSLVAIVDPLRVGDFVTSVANTVNKDAVNAVLGAKEGKVVAIKPHQDGSKLNGEQSVASIIAHVTSPVSLPNQTITLTSETVFATIQESTIEKLGLKEQIGRGETRFTGSPDNRVHNITVGANFLNGAIVPKDQEFSTIKTLGKIDGTTGYLPELVIKGDRTIPEFGGGLCQVSTTLFRATLNAGLPITARTNHSYRVGYYEPPVGLDATIFQNPDVDFKFKNDTPGYILIQSRVEGKKITFELYGTKDGRVSTVSDPIVTDITAPPPEIRTDTDTLPKGEVKQIEKPHDGATAVVHYSVSRDGQEIYKKTFRSRYVPWTARFLVGTKEG